MTNDQHERSESARPDAELERAARDWVIKCESHYPDNTIEKELEGIIASRTKDVEGGFTQDISSCDGCSTNLLYGYTTFKAGAAWRAANPIRCQAAVSLDCMPAILICGKCEQRWFEDTVAPVCKLEPPAQEEK